MRLKKKNNIESHLILHNIRSAHNVGAIFRTADALGVSKIYLTGYTPAPLDRFKRVNPAIAKTALGAETHIAWETAKRPQTVIKKLREQKFQIISIEQDARSKDYKKITPAAKTLFIVGSETSGLSKSILALSDVIAEIPMRGKKESLNVSVATGIALFRLLGI